MSKSQKPVVVAVCTALVGGVALAGSAFSMTSMSQGYMLGAQQAQTAEKAADAKATDAKKAEGSCGAKKAEGSCGAGKKTAEGKCGEGKCGMDKMDTDKDGKISKAEFAAAHGGKDDKFAAHDPNGDGFIDATEMKAHKEGKCGEGKGGADKKTGAKADMEGKCGEGKCGGGMM